MAYVRLVRSGDLLEEYYNDKGEVQISLLPIVWDSVNLHWAVDEGFQKNGIYLTSIMEWYGTENIKINGNIHDQKKII